MKEKDPLEKFLEEISKLLEASQKKDFKPTEEFPEDIEQRLELLASEVEKFKEINEARIAAAGISEKDIAETLAKIEQLPLNQRQLLEKAMNLKRTAEEIQRNYSIAGTVAKKAAGAKSKQIIKRKAKFRGIGGQKDWKPL